MVETQDLWLDQKVDLLFPHRASCVSSPHESSGRTRWTCTVTTGEEHTVKLTTYIAYGQLACLPILLSGKRKRQSGGEGGLLWNVNK